MFLFAYGFGAVIYLNCSLGKSEPKVIDKRISGGKNTSYYLRLTARSKQIEIDEVIVSKGLYQRIEINNEVNIYLRKGKLEIPWYIVTETKSSTVGE